MITYIYYRKAWLLEMQFEEICKENYAKIYNYVLAKTVNKEAAEDITQEVFFIAYQNKDNFCKHEKPLAFLYLTAKNLTCEYFRKIKKEIPCETIEAGINNEDVFEQICSQKEQAIDEGLYREQVLNKLNKSEKILYQKYYVDKENMSQIAGELGIKETAVRMKYVRIRKKVRRLVANLGLSDF